MCAFHPDRLGEPPDATFRLGQLEGQVFAFELLTGLAQRQVEPVRSSRCFGRAGSRALLQCLLDFARRDLAFAAQEVSRTPTDGTDVALDLIVTEAETIRPEAG